MTAPHIEYVGFTTKGTAREYTLRVRPAGAEPMEFTVAIPSEAFLARRVRYQDAPELCYLRLQREFEEGAAQPPASYIRVTDAELEEYRVAHAPKTRRHSKGVPG